MEDVRLKLVVSAGADAEIDLALFCPECEELVAGFHVDDLINGEGTECSRCNNLTQFSSLTVTFGRYKRPE
jgi:hypothetical protein